MTTPAQKAAHARYQRSPKGLSFLRRSKYGIDDETYHAMLIEQSGRCAICLLPMHSPEIDHNHKTKIVRALLCGKCNKAIGLLNDSAILHECSK